MNVMEEMKECGRKRKDKRRLAKIKKVK